jgi:hypothetical protein
MKTIEVPDRLYNKFIMMVELGMLAARRGELGWTKLEKDTVKYAKKLVENHREQSIAD